MSLTEKTETGHETTTINVMRQFQVSVAIASGTSSGTTSMTTYPTNTEKTGINGITASIAWTVPSIGASVTARHIITNENGEYIYDNYDYLADHTAGEHIINRNAIPLCKTTAFRVITSSAVVGDKTFTFDVSLK